MSTQVIAADTVVTLDDADRILSPGYVAIDDGVIIDIGEGRGPGAGALDLGARIVMPGLINAHTHTPMSLFRGVAEGHSLLGLEGWYNTIRRLELNLRPEMIPAPVELSCAEMLASGTTGFADQYFFTDQILPVVERSGMRTTLAYGVVELGDAAVRAQELDRVASFVRGSSPTATAGRVSRWIGPHAFFVDNTEASIVAEVDIARHAGAGLHTHFSTTGEEDRWCIAEHGMSALQRLDQLGVLDLPLVMAHCLQLDPADVPLLARAHIVIAIVASVAMASGEEASPVRALLDAGVRLGIGTDNVTNNGSYDLFEEMRTLSRLVAFTNKRPGVVSSKELLHMATRGGAAALGQADAVGVIAPGFAADVIALDTAAMPRGPRAAQPVYSSIVWAGGAASVTDAMVAGRWLYRDRAHLALDPAHARAECDAAFAELRALTDGDAVTSPATDAVSG